MGYANPDRYASESYSQASRWFGMELNYDWGFSKNQYNGNIAGTIWCSKGDDQMRAYGFDYDAANRLMKGDFTQYVSAGTWDNTTAGINYSMQMGDGANPATAYDANGNILAMQQYGYKPTNGSSLIDRLQYSYYNGCFSNKLRAVGELAGTDTTPQHLGDFTDGNTGTEDYAYDVNGNLVFDRNKAIATTASAITDMVGGVVVSWGRSAWLDVSRRRMVE